LLWALREDNPGVFRWVIQHERINWEEHVPGMLGTKSSQPNHMSKFLRVLCDEGICTVDMLEFAIKHGLDDVATLIRQGRSVVAGQHHVLTAIALQLPDAALSLLRGDPRLWHDRAVAIAAETQNPSLCNRLDDFIRGHVDRNGMWHYMRGKSETLVVMSHEGLTFLHRTFCCGGCFECSDLSDAYWEWVRHRWLGYRMTEGGRFNFGRPLQVVERYSPTSIRTPSLLTTPGTSTRRAMASGVNLVLSTLCGGLAQQIGGHTGGSVSHAQVQTLQKLCYPRLVWRTGILSIRRLMKGIPPKAATEMLAVLMVTYTTAAAEHGRIESMCDRVQ
jgi:hypothetical protein